MINRRLAVVVALFAPLAACVSGSDSTTPSANPNAGFYARFSPLADVLPFPNDLYFQHSDGSPNTTGQLSILPIGYPTTGGNAAVAAMDHLDGFGTQSAIHVYFTADVDAATLSGNVNVYQVSSDPTTKGINPPAPYGTGSATALKENVDYTLGVSSSTDAGATVVNIVPKKPLAGGTTYLVVVTDGVKDKSGDAATASADYQTVFAADAPVITGGKSGKTGNRTLDKVALFTLPQILTAVTQGVNPTHIVVTFSFSTQFTDIALPLLAAKIYAGGGTTQPTGVAIIDTGLTVAKALSLAKQTPPASAANAELFAGDLALPYYLTVPTAGNPTAALTDSWHNAFGLDTIISPNPAASEVPKATVPLNVIPVLVSIPVLNKGASGGCPLVAAPLTGWPVAIFQHGITRSREDMLAVAGSFASACIAVIAIDLPLHGVTDKTDPLYKNQLFAGTPAAALLTLPVSERTFDMDLQNNSTGVAGPDGTIDSSGAWFINLTSLLTSRDNLREGAADLLNLTATLPKLHTLTPPGTVNFFDSSKVFYVGHSLGAIVGTTFLGADTASGTPKIVAATLGMPGGNITNLLQNSAEFAPIINAGLAAQGVAQGTQFYDEFFGYAQAAVEDGDPANYAAFAVAAHPIHMIEVVGGLNASSDPGCNLPDLVVPNVSTDLLASLMGLTQSAVPAGSSGAAGANTIVRFLAGDHGSLLDPSVPGAPATCANDAAHKALYGGVTVEMQTEMVSFMAGGGIGFPVNNTNGFIK